MAEELKATETKKESKATETLLPLSAAEKEELKALTKRMNDARNQPHPSESRRYIALKKREAIK